MITTCRKCGHAQDVPERAIMRHAAAILGKRGGSSTSAAKQAASRANGRKGRTVTELVRNAIKEGNEE